MENSTLYSGWLESDGVFGEQTGIDLNVTSLDDLTMPLTQGTQQTSQDLPVANDEEAVEVQTFEVDARRSAKKGLSHSKDPIHGANKKGTKFWGRIKEYFDGHKKSTISRTETSIMHRWTIIQKDVHKFCCVYDKITRRNASGATIQDMINQALTTFKGIDEENKSFTLMHCYDILKDEDKWKLRMIELSQPQQPLKKKQKTNKDSTPNNVQANNNEEVAEVAVPGDVPRKRPPGQKETKQARRGGDDACIVAFDKMWEKKEARDTERDKVREADKAFIQLEKQRLENEAKVA
ncbi:hypothetical protein BDA96_06G111500 [Sorghum bicolor]|uniref:No apical meristem-associated C-terminal domain-containing protein n=1 Tax=Sorghum bicolor TaxID=4558 RepID=A0A921UBM0_SORBI|nr:hypothetical protein BDA96_06G111500 [Sorghum bicolor]